MRICRRSGSDSVFINIAATRSWLDFQPPQQRRTTTRKILNTLLNEQVLNDEGLLTLMCEVEAVINGLPITKVSEDSRNLEVLFPYHFLLL